jgi:hypothetical protein
MAEMVAVDLEFHQAGKLLGFLTASGDKMRIK